MRKIFLFIIIITFSNINAQIHEIGAFLGGSNYIGDVGNTSYVNPNELAFGILYKWNKSPRHAYRFSYIQSKITGNDSNSKERARKTRGYSFENSIKEFTAGLEFNFFDFNLHQLDRKITPYIFTGVSYFSYEELFVVNGNTQTDYTHSSFAIPMIIGVKSNITPHLILGVEIGARYALTDNLDGSNPRNTNLEPLKFGNINNKDWYVFSGITLTYTFGEKPCYCKQ